MMQNSFFSIRWNSTDSTAGQTRAKLNQFLDCNKQASKVSSGLRLLWISKVSNIQLRSFNANIRLNSGRRLRSNKTNMNPACKTLLVSSYHRCGSSWLDQAALLVGQHERRQAEDQGLTTYIFREVTCEQNRPCGKVGPFVPFSFRSPVNYVKCKLPHRLCWHFVWISKALRLQCRFPVRSVRAPTR